MFSYIKKCLIIHCFALSFIKNDVDVDLVSTVANKILAEGQPLTDDIKNFLLGTSDYAKDIQSDIDLYVTRGRHNQASFRRKKVFGEQKTHLLYCLKT